MEILVLNKYWFNLIGALPAQASGISILFRNILISSLLILDLVPTVYFFAENITDLVKTTAAFYVIGLLFIFIATYWNVLAHRTHLDELLHNLEDMIQMSNRFATFNTASK